jgi:hypothetical protein
VATGWVDKSPLQNPPLATICLHKPPKTTLTCTFTYPLVVHHVYCLDAATGSHQFHSRLLVVCWCGLLSVLVFVVCGVGGGWLGVCVLCAWCVGRRPQGLWPPPHPGLAFGVPLRRGQQAVAIMGWRRVWVRCCHRVVVLAVRCSGRAVCLGSGLCDLAARLALKPAATLTGLVRGPHLSGTPIHPIVLVVPDVSKRPPGGSALY